MKKILIIITSVIIAAGIAGFQNNHTRERNKDKKMSAKYDNLPRATFAGGCFWCVESDFEKAVGVVKVVSGYTGGSEEDPAYKDVSAGKTGHVEAVQVIYDPEKISYKELLDIFWRHIDPTDPGGQFADRGSQYVTAVFYHDDKQKRIALESKQKLEASGIFDKQIVTHIKEFNKFYEAEAYHQDYYKKNPIRYKMYRYGSGRDQFLENVWKDNEKEGKSDSGNRQYDKPSGDVLKKKLTPLQYRVTQQDDTEQPFDNEYWDNKKAGIYTDIVSGEPLFSSIDKFKSGTGWPSFTKPIERGNIVEHEDQSLFIKRIEVRSRLGDSHLGHVFSDGPPPTGLRYCINSASLKFISRDDLKKEGYGKFESLFKGN